MSDVKLYKLTSGEEIMATEVTFGDNTTILKDVVSLVYQPTQDGQMTAGFAPYMPYSDGSITFQDTAIGSVANPKSDILAEYTRVFSKIEIFPAGSIIT